MSRFFYIFFSLCIVCVVIGTTSLFNYPKFPVVLIIDNRENNKMELAEDIFQDSRWYVSGVIYIDSNLSENEVDSSIRIAQNGESAFMIAKHFFHNTCFIGNEKNLVVVPSSILMRDEQFLLDDVLADSTYLILIADGIERWIPPDEKQEIPTDTNVVLFKNPFWKKEGIFYY